MFLTLQNCIVPYRFICLLFQDLGILLFIHVSKPRATPVSCVCVLCVATVLNESLRKVKNILTLPDLHGRMKNQDTHPS